MKKCFGLQDERFLDSLGYLEENRESEILKHYLTLSLYTLFLFELIAVFYRRFFQR